MQCQQGKSNDNPTVLQFVKNSDTIRQVGLMWFDDAKGNFQKSVSVQQSIDDTKLLPLDRESVHADIHANNFSLTLFTILS